MRRHETDPLALVAGVLFLIIGGAYLLGELAGNEIDARWVLPVALIAVGLAGLLTSLIELARRREARTNDSADQAAAERPTTAARATTAESGWSENTPSTPARDDSSHDGDQAHE